MQRSEKSMNFHILTNAKKCWLILKLNLLEHNQLGFFLTMSCSTISSSETEAITITYNTLQCTGIFRKNHLRISMRLFLDLRIHFPRIQHFPRSIFRLRSQIWGNPQPNRPAFSAQMLRFDHSSVIFEAKKAYISKIFVLSQCQNPIHWNLRLAFQLSVATCKLELSICFSYLNFSIMVSK